MLCYICSKSSQDSQDLFFETKKYVTILDKLLQSTTTTTTIKDRPSTSILDQLSTSASSICLDCKEKLEQVSWIFGQIEELQWKLNAIKRQVEGDLVKSQRFCNQNPVFTDGVQVLGDDLEAVKPEPFNFLELDYDNDDNGNVDLDLDLDVPTPEGISRNHTEEFNLKGCQVVLERNKEPSSSLNNSFADKNKRKSKRVCTICPYCSKNCKTTRFLKIHTRTHTGEPLERPFSCSHCDKAFSTKNNLKGHVKNVHKIGDALVKCPSCDYTGDTHSVKKHSIVHSTDKTLKCDFCDYSTNRKNLLKDHIDNKHTSLDSKGSLLCQPSSSNSPLANNDNDNQNQFNITSKRMKVCTICQFCSKDCKTTRFLKIHTRTHTGEPLERPFSCSHCDKSFSTKNNLKGHITNVHKIGDSLVKCPSCNYIGDQNSVKKHSIVHSTEKTLKCELCDYSTNRNALLKDHINRKHSSLEPSSSNSPFADNDNDNQNQYNMGSKTRKVCTICPFCSKDCKTTRFLKIHTRTHTGEPLERPFKCSHCDKSFSTKNFLKGHITNVHKIGDDLVKCPSCDYTGDTHSVKRHSIMHSVTKSLQCEFCEFSTNRKTSLKYHIDHRHLGHKGSFLCQVCSRLLSTESQLRLHIKKFHDEAFTHFCPTCRKGFVDEKILEKHQLTHNTDRTRTRNFVCDQCPRTYESDRSLKHHISIRHTGETKRFKCQICSKLFFEQRTLDNHMQLHMPDDKNLHECQFCGESYVLKKSLSWHIRVRHLNPDKFLHTDPAKRKKFVRRNKVPIIKDTNNTDEIS